MGGSVGVWEFVGCVGFTNGSERKEGQAEEREVYP